MQDDASAAPARRSTRVLTYQVVAGRVMAADVVKLKDAKTVEGSMLTIDTKDGVKVNKAKV